MPPVGELKAHPTPKNFHDLVAKMVSRAGLMGVFMTVRGQGPGQPSKEIDPETFIRVSDFKAGPAEKVGGRDAKVVSFTAKIADKDNAKVTLWLDAQTSLPLKRLIVPEKDNVRITETYTEFSLDPKVEARTFELPK
jgi:hypothetical protein